MKNLLVIIFLIIIAHGVNAKTYYVDGQNGSDTNVGTQEHPFKTISKSISVLKQNDLVNWTNIEKIEYHEAFGIISKQDDKVVNVSNLDEGKWKERVNYIENSSSRASLGVKITFQYKISESGKRKSMRCVGTEKEVIK